MTSLRDQLWPMVRALGVDTVFGNPGSTELTMLNGFPDDLTYHLGLHESAVVSMADGHAQTTGRPVMVNLHTAPGLGNAVGSLVTARWSRAPLVVTAGQQVRAMMTSENWLVNVDATTLPRPAVKWSYEPPRPADVPAALARAVHTAMTAPRGPVFVSLPMDDWDGDADQRAVDDLAARAVHGHSGLPAGELEPIAEALSARARSSRRHRPGLPLAHAVAERFGLDVWTAPSAGRRRLR